MTEITVTSFTSLCNYLQMFTIQIIFFVDVTNLQLPRHNLIYYYRRDTIDLNSGRHGNEIDFTVVPLWLMVKKFVAEVVIAVSLVNYTNY